MKVIIDNRDTNTKVIDDKLVQYGEGNQVIKLIGKPDDKTHNIIINIIADGLDLTDSERELYKVIVNSIKYSNGHDYVITNDAIQYASRVNDKSIVTYKRAIEGLIKMGVIRYVVNRTGVAINKEYDVEAVGGVVAKYIVIELRYD